MDQNTMTVLIVLIIAILIIVLVAWMWIYTSYMGGYHHMNTTTINGMMHSY